jgi:membrane fusion protein (multidrug efflux system)
MRVSFAILFACLALVPAFGYAAPGDQGQASLPLVAVAKVGLEDANRPEKYIGHVQAIDSVRLRARVQGYLEEIDFQEGGLVQRGQTMYQIEQHPYQTRVKAAQAKVTQARAELSKAESRLRRLLAAKPESVRQTDLDDAKAARDLAQGRLQEAKANLELARIDLGYTRIKAPIEGRVGKSLYQRGALVGPGSGPLAEIVRLDPIRVEFSISEQEMPVVYQALTNGQNDKPKVSLELPGQGAYGHKGRVEFIDNQVDAQTGTIAVWARFANPKARLVPGEYVRVFVRKAKPDMRPAVPQVAVQRDHKGAFVYVLDKDQRVEKRRVQTGSALAKRFIVKSGLDGSERVIVQGLQKVTPGIKVKVQTTAKGDR